MTAPLGKAPIVAAGALELGRRRIEPDRGRWRRPQEQVREAAGTAENGERHEHDERQHQRRAPSSRLRTGQAGASGANRGPGAAGQAHLEAGAARVGLVDRDRAVVMLGDPLRDREPETGAAVGRAGCPPEPIEHVGAILGRDARPGVLDRERRARRRRRDG